MSDLTTREALLAACRANRDDDDLPRLVFADFLDESGSEADAARAMRIRHAVRYNNREDFISLDEIGGYTTWDRGFVVGAVCSAAWWLQHGDDLIREHDVQRVRLTTWPRQTIVRSPLGRATHVSLSTTPSGG